MPGETQSTYIKEVISSQHVLLEDDQSLEVLLVQGPAARLHALCDALRKVRGVQQIKLVTTTALLPPLHSHGAERAREPDRPAREADDEQHRRSQGAQAQHGPWRNPSGGHAHRAGQCRSGATAGGVAADSMLWEETIARGGLRQQGTAARRASAAAVTCTGTPASRCWSSTPSARSSA